MNDIGIGIMCFGDKKYFSYTEQLIILLEDIGISTYILTDQPHQFPESEFINTINYNRNIKSYHDKIQLVKPILENHEICILIDADIDLQHGEVIDDLLNYPFKEGITYIDTLLSHPYKKEKIGEIDHTTIHTRWHIYYNYIEKLLPNFSDLETIYEYFTVFKRTIPNEFYKQYEELQIVKEYCDVISNKTLIGAGEGVSLQIAANITNTPIRRDEVLYNLITDKIKNINQSK